MARTLREYKLLFVVLFIIVFSIYALSPFLAHLNGRFPFLSGADGEFYVLRLKSALLGDSTLSCPFDPHLKSELTFVTSKMEYLWASLLKLFIGQNIHLAVVLTYLVLPGLVFVLLVYTIHKLFVRPFLALILGFFGVVDGSVYYWKLFSAGSVEIVEPLPYFRFANPMLFIIPFILAFAGFFYIVIQNAKRDTYVYLGSKGHFTLFVIFLGGFLFYDQIFYALYFVMTLGVFALLCAIQGKRKQFDLTAIVLLGVLLVGLPSLIESIDLVSTPGMLDVLNRVGLLVSTPQAYFTFHKGLIFTFVAYQFACWNERNIRWKFLTAAMIAGYLCLNQSFVTGVSNHDQHYFRPLMITYLFVLADFLTRVSEWVPHWIQNRYFKWPAAVVIICLVSGFGAWRVFQLADQSFAKDSYSLSSNRFEKTLATLKGMPVDEKGIILADPALTYPIEVITDHWSYIHPYYYECIVPDDLLFKRWSFLGKVFGWDHQEVSAFLTKFIKDSSLPYWLFGLPASFAGEKNKYNSLSLELRKKVWTESYDSITLKDVVEEQHKTGVVPRYLLKSPGYEPDFKVLKPLFSWKLLFEVPEERTSLWAITPRN